MGCDGNGGGGRDGGEGGREEGDNFVRGSGAGEGFRELEFRVEIVFEEDALTWGGGIAEDALETDWSFCEVECSTSTGVCDLNLSLLRSSSSRE